jgi:hypothetical protein
VALDFWIRGPDTVGVFALTASGLITVQLRFPWQELLPKIEAWYVSTRGAPAVSGTDVFDDLDAYLFLPLRRRLRDENIRGLYLVPHGRLHLLPLHAARSPEGYLCDEFEIAYLPSSALLAQLAAPSLDGGVFSLANPERGTCMSLPLADWEGEQLERRFGASRGGVFCRVPDATFARTAEWSGATLIHFGCHGVGDESFAPLSHLRLADDLLLAQDVVCRRPPLRPGAVVVLNGCQTAVRDARSLDESMGLKTAFLLRGASFVLATSWSVADRCAADLALSFLDRLLAGDCSPTRALRQAQRTVRGLSLDDVLHRQEEVERATPVGSPDRAGLLASKAQLCWRFGRASEGRHFAEATAPALRGAGLGDVADGLLEQARSLRPAPEAGKPGRAGDEPRRRRPVPVGLVPARRACDRTCARVKARQRGQQHGEGADVMDENEQGGAAPADSQDPQDRDDHPDPIADLFLLGARGVLQGELAQAQFLNWAGSADLARGATEQSMEELLALLLRLNKGVAWGCCCPSPSRGTRPPSPPWGRSDRPCGFSLGDLPALRGPAGQADSPSGWLRLPLGRHVLPAACRSDQLARESFLSEPRRGLFSAHLLRSLQAAQARTGGGRSRSRSPRRSRSPALPGSGRAPLQANGEGVGVFGPGNGQAFIQQWEGGSRVARSSWWHGALCNLRHHRSPSLSDWCGRWRALVKAPRQKAKNLIDCSQSPVVLSSCFPKLVIKRASGNDATAGLPLDSGKERS